ncbi:MAG: T9SS type A sorting domain-containing protein [bacterium]
MFDSFGKLILESSNNEIVNIQNLPTGLYHVTINTKQGKSYRSKFIKE